MTYVDGFVIAVPTANRAAYLKLAEESAAYFRKHGALSVVECWGEEVPEGKMNSFHTAVLRKPDETVVFSWITWPDKATRDAGNKKVFEDMEADGFDMSDAPFDGKRMIFGGFETLFEG